ncbi:methyl-accepting chemotaxis protein [Kineothrix alysoides]|uniref:Methyl-accepting chemotaxis protein n=2 Tax=Kineothrix alysoides TaxID=1469948 RepID=A0A4R1QJK2_9FIRM|nr:methyl-accepting chemotaxis protein [Kineothrix alysoides]
MKKHEKKETGKQRKKGFFGSLKSKMLALSVSSIAIAVSLTLAFVIPFVANTLIDMNMRYMSDVCNTTGENLDAALNRNGVFVLNKNTLGTLFGKVGMEGIDSSYVYVVLADGNMAYHPEEEKVGLPVENSFILEVVNKLQSSKSVEEAYKSGGEVLGLEEEIPEAEKSEAEASKASVEDIIQNDVVSYDYNGLTKYAAYYITADRSAILVLTADASEILSSAYLMGGIAALIGIAVLILGGIISYRITARLMNPLLQITTEINRFSTLDFTENPTSKRLSLQNDETGQIARAIAELRVKLVDIVSQIKKQSANLYESANRLDNNAMLTSSTVKNVEAAVGEIASGANNQASETQKATENIIDMGNMIEHTNYEVDSLNTTAAAMKSSSDEASDTLQQLDEINKRAITSIDIIYEQTNTTNASAMKIKEATTLISSIADETNLLSLNASIEAARAGDAGRGFAVVAAQIQKLAEQSNNSAREIDKIIHTLIEDSQKAVTTMNQVKEIMKSQSEKVTKTGSVFTQVREGIHKSIRGVGEIADKTAHLDEARTSVVDIVQNLTAIAQQNAASTEETSASVIEVSNIMTEISDNAKQLKEIAAVLEENMFSFQL